MQILDGIPFQLDYSDLLRRVHLEEGTDEARQIQELADAVVPLATPKALYGECYIEDKGKDSVAVTGPRGSVTLTSPILRANLETAERLFPYIATCGAEMDRADLCGGDMLMEYWLDSIKSLALGAALSHLGERLERRFALGKTSTMSPGSADAAVWPIEQQRQLFGLFGDVEALIGVRLTDSCLMVPNKTVSGVRFPTELDFRSCQICHREDCPSRSAAFDAERLASYEHGLECDV